MKYESFLTCQLKCRELIEKSKHGFTENLHLVLSFNYDKGWVVDNQSIHGKQKEYKIFGLNYVKALDYFNIVYNTYEMKNDF